MPIVTEEQLQRTISLLGEGDRRDTEIEIAVGRFAPDRITTRRLVGCIPEAFGLVLLPHVANVILPTTFSVRAADGSSTEFPLEREPIYAAAVEIAGAMYRDNPRGIFSNIARRSALVAGVNRALDEGRSLEGARIAGPVLAGVPADFYEPKSKAKAASFWRKLVG